MTSRAPGIFLALSLVVLAGLCGFAKVREDPAADYALREFFLSARFRKHDELIAQAARRNGVSPSLVKAVVWRESGFQSHKRGADGERGLMQVTEIAATDWVNAENIQTFAPTDLLDPKTNLDAGTWYLARALRHWSGKDDPVPFALAEFNAGRSRVKRWERESEDGGETTAADLKAAMDFPTTRQYIASIVERYSAYLARGEFGENPSSPALTPPASQD